jgi:hypothetical protein
MRTLWIALLIALLPLRGWVGDAMAVTMAVSPHTAAALMVAGDCPHAGSTHIGEHGGQNTGEHSAQHAEEHTGGHDAGHAHAPADAGEHGAVSAHLLCDVCNGPVLGSAAPLTPGSPQEHGLHITRSEPFASLAPRHVVKPPIA